MKRILLSLVLLFIVVAIHAQVNIEKVATFNSQITIIPQHFTTDNSPKIVTVKEWKDGYGFYAIHDDKLKLERIFKISNSFNPLELRFIDYDSGNYYIAPNNTIMNNINFTQTLFNNDSKLEFLASAFSDPDNTDTWGLWVINEDGDFLQKLDIRNDIKLILKMSGEYYFVVTALEGGYDCYKITNGGATSSPVFLKGDINADGSVDAQDASLILQYVANKITW